MENKLTVQEKIELAYWLCEHNKGYLTGSLMLYLIGLDLGREPHDIDIIVTADTLTDEIILPPFTKILEMTNKDGYLVIKRVQYMDTIIEFIAHDSTIPFYEQKTYLTHKQDILPLTKNFDIVTDIFDTKILRYAFLTDLVEAKEYYLMHDTNAEYLEKTRKDLEIIKNWDKFDEYINKEKIKLSDYQEMINENDIFNF